MAPATWQELSVSSLSPRLQYCRVSRNQFYSSLAVRRSSDPTYTRVRCPQQFLMPSQSPHHNPKVLAVMSTSGRAAILNRALHSLKDAGPNLAGVVVNDNGETPETESLVMNAPVPSVYVKPTENLGCGGGVANALRTALLRNDIDYFWILDDDCVVQSGSLEPLMHALDSGFHAAVPMVVAATGVIGWFPGLLEPEPWAMIKRFTTPEKYRAAFGVRPVRFSWAPWCSLLVSRTALLSAGLPRADYGFQGEDIEFTLRLTYHVPGVFVPESVTFHLPPVPPIVKSRTRRVEINRAAWMLQNNAYTATRLPHGRRALKFLPSNCYRLFRTFGLSGNTLTAAGNALLKGLIIGVPAGRSNPPTVLST